MALDVQVVSPERILWSGQADRVVTRVVDGGDIAFLAGHTSYVGQLASGVTEIATADGGPVIRVAVHGGFVELSEDHVSLLSDQAELAADIDVVRAESAKERAEAALKSSDGDADALAAAERANTRLRAVSDSPV